MLPSFLPNAGALFSRLPRILRRHRLMTLWMKLTREDPIQPVQIRRDSPGFVDLREGVLRLIVVEGEFEPEFFQIADVLLANGGHFFDVGANHGLLSFGLAARWSDRVTFHLFEPNPKLIATIKRSISLYPRMQVSLNPIAVSDFEGEVHIAFNDSHSGESYVTSDGGTSVRCHQLDNYLAEQKIDEVTLLKIDVEGFELAALRGLSKSLQERKVKALYFEYCEKWLSRHHPPMDLIQFLQSCGYLVFYCRPQDLSRFGDRCISYRPSQNSAPVLLAPISGTVLPSATDLLAIPEDLVARFAIAEPQG